MPNMNYREEMFAKNKKHLDDIQSGKSKPDIIVRPKQSIYAKFAEKLEGKSHKEIIVEIEIEVKRIISEFPLDVATKRIMELIWVTRYEW